MPVYDGSYDGGVEHLLCRHEQGAAMVGIGYARATGKTGVRIATSGPAHQPDNRGLRTDCQSHPCRCHHRSSVRTVYRHYAFQEVDVLGLSLACTKHSFLASRWTSCRASWLKH
ncbi:thiamine pyrophosphate-binding protein [Escherichia coli]